MGFNWRWTGSGQGSVAHFSDPAMGSLTRCPVPGLLPEESCPEIEQEGCELRWEEDGMGEGTEDLPF